MIGTSHRVLFVLSLVGSLLQAKGARAQIQQGQIKGVITAKDTGRPIGGVTVTVSGPALQAEQTEFTDAAGRYLITQIPPGDGYVVRLYFNDVAVERPGIRITEGTTLTVSLSMPTQRGESKAYVIRERAPNVDTASATAATEVNQEILQNTPMRGRTYESALTLAPGTVDAHRDRGGDVGVSISGSTGGENAFLIDGLNTTDPSLGLLGTQLHHAFLKEVNIITGGYQAEYGRSTGGVVSVITKSGSNELHGGVFLSVVPFQLEPRTLGRFGEALAVRKRMRSQYDFGFDVGGPLWKDRIWFYAGFAPNVTSTQADRVVRGQTFDPSTGRAQVDPGFSCPSYLASSGYCDGPRALALRTDEIGGRAQEISESENLLNWIGKLQFNLNRNHNLVLSYIGSRRSFSGHALFGNPNAGLLHDPAATRLDRNDQVHDLTARYVGKLFDQKLQIEVMYGLHHQANIDTPPSADQQGTIFHAAPQDPFSLADFEDVSECRRRMRAGPMGMTAFNPCPVTSYLYKGYTFFGQSVLQRHVLLPSVTYYARLLGTHALKLGFDFEAVVGDLFISNTGPEYNPADPLSGQRVYNSSADGRELQIFREIALPNPDGSGTPIHANGLRNRTETRNYALYLRDSWHVGFLPGLVLNLGVRWEAQELFGANGDKQIAIYDNWSPRVGAVYDFTRKGRSKIFANYGRFYYSIPMDLNNRTMVPGGGFGSPFSSTCPTVALQPEGRPVPVAGPSCNFDAGGFAFNGVAQVQPGLKGQSIDEVSAGVQYDVGLDIVLGAAYIHRRIGDIIEDLSAANGYYFIGNPGMKADPQVAGDLQRQADDLAQRAKADPMNGNLQTDAQNAKLRLSNYQANGAVFPRPRRDYHALQLTANKRLSSRFSLIASYTYSRTLGNYPGTYSASNGQLNPGTNSFWDLPDLLVNRDGPLPTDRPHNFKLTGYYAQPIGRNGSLIGSLSFTAFSGRPIEVLGTHLYYGENEVFILPRGSGGRTPTVTQFDLHVGYDHQLSKLLRLGLFVDVINVANQREVINVDDLYTSSVVGPLVNGKAEDLRRLTAVDGSLPIANSNYGQPTGYQAPLYMRLGARLSF